MHPGQTTGNLFRRLQTALGARYRPANRRLKHRGREVEVDYGEDYHEYGRATRTRISVSYEARDRWHFRIATRSRIMRWFASGWTGYRDIDKRLVVDSYPLDMARDLLSSEALRNLLLRQRHGFTVQNVQDVENRQGELLILVEGAFVEDENGIRSFSELAVQTLHELVRMGVAEAPSSTEENATARVEKP